MRIFAKRTEAKRALSLVERLQDDFVGQLNALSRDFGTDRVFEAIEWKRDGGIHGGGVRYESRDPSLFNSASINVSQVHYDEDETKKLSSATAISAIVHPANPHAPSMHMHISWTQMRDGAGYWRMMGDLNPSLENTLFQKKFETALKEVAKEHYEEAKAQGERYFTIPVLGRTRGVSHFYLENFNRGDFEIDKEFAKEIGSTIIDVYHNILTEAFAKHTSSTLEEKMRQIDYHTLYLFQVLTLDRGTTSGLLVHDQNDIGIMGSIPLYINRPLLQTWLDLMPHPQEKLLLGILDALPSGKIVQITATVKKALADAVRAHYKEFPHALNMQAGTEIVADTVDNHQ